MAQCLAAANTLARSLMRSHDALSQEARRIAGSSSRSFKARFSSAWTSRFEIMSLAAHEFVHGAFGIGQHSEDYAAKLTEVTAVLIANVKD